MQSARISYTTTISLPPMLYKAAVATAKAKGMTNSELFREAFRRYLKEERKWQELLSRARAAFRRAGIRTERDVERLIDSSRK